VNFYISIGLGEVILVRPKNAQLGDGFLNQLNDNLMTKFPDVKGFSKHNLELIRNWHQVELDTSIAKQLVAQVASIMQDEVVAWEKLFWFLKFLIPKLMIKDADYKQLDALLDSVDLNYYVLKRVNLNYNISLDEAETELDR